MKPHKYELINVAFTTFAQIYSSFIAQICITFAFSKFEANPSFRPV